MLTPSRICLREIRNTKVGRHFKNGFLVTLNPNKFAEKKQQPFDIGSNQQSFKPNVALLKQPGHVFATLPLLYDSVNGKKRTFPPDTKAFLYYSMSPEKPRIAGELRLRVTSSNDPASFESGTDLVRADGQLWSRPLYSLLKYYFPLYEKLKEDRLVPDDLDTVLSTLPLKAVAYRRSHLHYTLNDTFTIDFSIKRLHFIVTTEQGVETLVLYEVFSDNRTMQQGRRPYTGSALARFERSMLPEHEGTRTIVIRFLKIITPVKCVLPLYDGHLCCPKEGELYMKSHQVWAVNIDKFESMACYKRVRGFQLLWDT